jgi:ribosomal protein S18 acetylase RimI-like enzyme
LHDFALIQAPSLGQIQAAIEWLASQPQQNPDLEIGLHLIVKDQIVPHDRGGLVAIAHTSDKLTDIQGIVLAQPGNRNVSMVSADASVTEALLALVSARGCPQRLCTDGYTKAWVRPWLLQRYQLQRESDQQVLICTQAPAGAAGRWAAPQDKPALQAYAEQYLAERGSGSLAHPWDDWIQQRRIAVLEQDGQVVAVVRRGETADSAIVVAPFTFPQFRRQGFARRLLAFFMQEMLQEFPAVKLWVNEDNVGAIALYNSLNYQLVGECYTGYFTDG